MVDLSIVMLSYQRVPNIGKQTCDAEVHDIFQVELDTYHTAYHFHLQ